MLDDATDIESEMAPALADSVIAPVCVIPLVPTRVNAPVASEPLAMDKAPLFVIETAPVPKALKVTAPVKALEACVKVMAVFVSVSVKLDAPATVKVPPVCVIAPPAETVRLPTDEVVKFTAPLVVNWAKLALLLKATVPVRALLCVKVMALAPALKLEVPGTVKIPVCVIAPPAIIAKFCPTVEVANCSAPPVVS